MLALGAISIAGGWCFEVVSKRVGFTKRVYQLYKNRHLLGANNELNS